MAKKEIEQTEIDASTGSATDSTGSVTDSTGSVTDSISRGKQNSNESQRMVSVVEPYELPEGWKWVQQRYCHTDSILLRKISGNSKGEN